MTTTFNQTLLQAIELRLPSKSKQVDLLTSLISLGKEAAYRRLRGEVLFTFEEACKIATKLGFSLDNITHSTHYRDKSIWSQNIIMPDEINNYSDYYFELVVGEHENFTQLLADPNLYTMGAFDTPPHALVFPFSTLFRFRCFEWIYRINKGTNPIKLEDIQFTSEQESRTKILSETLIAKTEQIFIFDRRIYTSVADLVRYFSELNLINPEERAQLKEELIASLIALELIAIEGKSRTKEERLTWTFISNIDLNGNYTYVKGSGFEFSTTVLYQLSAAVSSDARVCQMQRLWIESLRKYSTLISIGGDKERSAFFEEQKKHIEQLLSF